MRSGGLRGLAGVADQFTFSIGNFLLTILVARAVHPSTFAVFVLFYAASQILGGVSRGLCGESFVIRLGGRPLPESRRRPAREASISWAMTLGLTGSVGFLLSAIVTNGSARSLAYAFASIIPFVLIQDTMRYFAIASRRPQLALASDALSVAVFLLVRLVIDGAVGAPASDVIGWGAGAAAGILTFYVSSHTDVRGLSGLPIWVRGKDGAFSVRLALENLIDQANFQTSTFVVSGVAGLLQTARLKVAQSAFVLPTLLATGLQTVLLPDVLRSAERSRRDLYRSANLLTAFMIALQSAWLIGLQYVPSSVGRKFFGQSWALAHSVLLLWGLSQILTALAVAPALCLRALKAGAPAVRYRLSTAIMEVVALSLGGALDGARGVAIANIIASPLQAALWWVGVLRLPDETADASQGGAVRRSQLVATPGNELVDEFPS